MRKKRIPVKMLCIIVSLLLLLQVVGCGTIMYPERRGQNQGQIDSGMAILDGLGLLLFIIPGVVAFAVDFSTGAIYYPAGTKPKKVTIEKVAVIHVDPAELKEKNICEIMQKNAGCPVDTLSNAKVYALNGVEEVGPRLAEAAKSEYRTN